MTLAKHFLASWTIWYGIGQIALGVLGIFSGNLEQSQAWTLIITGLGTIGLRIKTTQPVTIEKL